MTAPASPFVVAGGGAAGLLAALTAAAAGVDVLVLEKDLRRGCNAEFSGGLVQGAGTRFQEAAGIDDSPATLLADILRQNRGRCDPAIAGLVADRSRDVVHTLADTVGLDLHIDAVEYSGHSVRRLHCTPAETGKELITGLRSYVRALDRVSFVDAAEVVDVQVADDGALDVVVRRGGTGHDQLRARHVLLATAGFGANRALLRRHIGDAAADSHFIGSENSTGAGLEIGLRLGAGTAYLTAYEGHSHLNPKYGTRLGGALPALGSIIVGADGRRFAREDVPNSGFAAALARRPGGRGIEIFDEPIHLQALANGAYAEAFSVGAVTIFATLEELADAFGLPAAALAEEVERYNAAVDGPCWLGRADVRPRLRPPYYASAVTSGLVHTQGGLTIDTAARVVRTGGEPIPGLLAAGGAAAGISGDGPDTYLSGNGLAHAFATGLVAAETVVAALA
ncbi:FAD-binding protein [Dactylosporangium sp. NPDC000521]|uniref:FAD-binding protein n=1 Tax=Dactylosporangium sp. NPDC000521 TaxID=3363975 RepID=UPI0036A5D97D